MFLDRIFLSGSSGDTYWFARFGGTLQTLGLGVSVDNDGNVYATGYNREGTSSWDIGLVKYNSSATLQWQRKLARTSGEDIGRSVYNDSSGNVYVLGTTTSANIVKFDSSGTLQWGRQINHFVPSSGDMFGVNASGNSCFCGGFDTLKAAYYNSSGTLQWQRQVYNATYPGQYGYAGYIDSSGNAYLGGQTASSVGNIGYVSKFNSSGTVQWQRTQIVTTLGPCGMWSITTDSSDNVYACGYSAIDGTGSYYPILVKYNSSGTFQWCRTLNLRGTGQSVKVDSIGNVYLLQQSQVAGFTGGYIIKFNSSGTIIWRRALSISSGGFSFEKMYIDQKDNVYVVGTLNNNYFIAKVPSDGSLTGSYVLGSTTVTYADGGPNAVTRTGVSGLFSVSPTTSTDTESASTLISSTTTLTSTVTIL